MVVVIGQFSREWLDPNKVHDPKPPRQNVQLSWTSPPDNWCKLNVDGSYKSKSGHICTGGLLRNSYGF